MSGGIECGPVHNNGGQHKRVAKGTVPQQAISPTEIDFSALGQDLASELYQGAAGSGEARFGSAATQYKVPLQGTRWKHKSLVTTIP